MGAVTRPPADLEWANFADDAPWEMDRDNIAWDRVAVVLRDVAEAIGMHESTVSRVTANKYIHTPRGVFEFRYFFSSHLAGEEGEQSSTAVRAKIRKLLSGEDPEKPLSDIQIAQMLSAGGVTVARRTVAKYREAMKIPSSSDRKRKAVG